MTKKKVTKPKTVKKEEPNNVITLANPSSIGSTGPSNFHIRSQKIADLLNLLNNSDRNLRFWLDKNQFGDIVGIVPLIRTIEEKKGSIYFEFIDKKEDHCCKFIVIDIDHNDMGDYKYSDSDLKKETMLLKHGMIYIKSNNINDIFKRIDNII